MSNGELQDEVQHMLKPTGGGRRIRTHFSIWTASLSQTLLDEEDFGSHSNVSITDTENLDESVGFLLISDLRFLDPPCKKPKYEYHNLAFGIIARAAYSSAPFSTFTAHGIHRSSRRIKMGNSSNSFPISTSIVRLARSVGLAYGPHLGLPMTIAIMSLEKR